MALLSGWSSRKRIDLPVPTADLTGFPVCIKIVADADIGAACLASGYDIRFTAEGGTTLLDYERESFAVSGGEATGIFWVKTDVATTGTYIWCYYGNAGAPDVSSGPAVFGASGANFSAVYHMNDVTTSTILDSTGNGNNGAKKGAGEPAEATGQVAKGQDFDGTDDYVRTAGAMASPGIPLTISMWVNSPASNPFALFDSAPAVQYSLRNNPAGYIERQDGGSQVAFDANTGAWTHLVFTYVLVGANDVLSFYKNGAFVRDGNAGNGDHLGWGSFTLGAINTSYALFDGLIDEVRVSSSARSAAWIAYEYANMNPADGGLTWWDEETVVSSFWVEFIGIIRDISISGPNITYKCEVATGLETTSHSTLVVMNAAIASATSGLSIVQLDGNTVLAPSAAAVTLDAPAITLVPGADTELYAEHDAMEITAELADINAHWVPYNCTITPTADAGGGSTYVGLIVRGEASGDAHVHSSHIADLVLGTTYDFSMKYNYPIGYAYCTLRLYQVVGSTLTQVGATRTLSQDTWTTLPFSLTAIATGALQARLSFATTNSEEWDELRIDDIGIKEA